MASTDDAAFIIGGYQTGSTVYNTIAEFRDNTWTQHGVLNSARRLHGSISSGSETMIIGGDDYSNGNLPTEVWNFYNGNHRLIEPTLSSDTHRDGVALYLVDPDFCRKQ